MGEWAGFPPERNSAGFWFGPGAGTFFSSAATLEALAGLLMSILGGHEAAAGAQGAAWMSPAGAVSLAANIPYQAWIAEAAAQLSAAGAQIQATGEGFEALKAGTDTPGQVAENQAEHVALNLANIFGILTPLIIANRAEYTRKWVTAAANMYSYSALSAAGVQAIPPLPPPVPTGTPSAAGVASGAAQAATDKPLEQALGGPGQSMNTLLPLLGQLMAAPSQLGQIAGGSQVLSGLTQLPQQALSPFQSLIGQFANAGAGLDASGAADAAAGSWITATPAAGGPVSAALSGGPGGIGAVGPVSSALRGPVSWSSTVAASPSAAPESAAPISRIVEARAASTMPATMGSSGAMMAPLAHGAGRDSDNASLRDSAGTLLAAATLYRPPEGLPVVTGGSGAQFVTGEEDRQSY